MSIASRIARLETALAKPLAGCEICCAWPSPRERVLRLVDDDADPDPWLKHGKCLRCGRVPDRMSLVDLIREAGE